MQCSLFGGGAARFDPAFPAVRRVQLAGGAWIEHHPGWLEGHSRVFEQLASQAAWHSVRRQMYEREVAVPRLLAQPPESGPMAELLRQLSQSLSERYGWALSRVSLAHYRDGRDSVAFHGDKVGRLANDCVIATVSVGAPRRFLLAPQRQLLAPQQARPARQRPASSQEEEARATHAFDLGWGDLFVMGGSCQRTWQHAVPKRAHADPRISIMFRPPLPA
jgi:alkylated DNA repair dioxygenase AlkB